MNGNIKLGKLLCDQDIITKRQLNKALQLQVKGDKRTIGEILVELGYCEFDDITDALLGSDEDTKHHEEKSEEIHSESKSKNEYEKEEPVELSEDKVMNTKFTMSVQTIIALVGLISAGVGGYYMLLQEIEEAKQLPAINVEEIFSDEYPSKPEGHNWPRSYEQYKTQVGQLQEDMDEVFDQLEEYEETIDELEKQVTNLRVKVGNK
tara:strand:+ start:105 stop:725 length:621 start_codon:yes stop_codon:yes gene_type:complete